ncbi:hypothetical protein N9937_02185 [bacterium]|nr:hypothetical protein [bacterium]
MPEQEFIPREVYEEKPEEETEEVTFHRADWESTLTQLATQPGTKVTIPRAANTVRRKQVIEAFSDAFTLIGGTPRLAIWADENPTEFYRLYSKLMPKEQTGEVNHEVKIMQVLPRGALD